jgi:hypothetical protein
VSHRRGLGGPTDEPPERVVVAPVRREAPQQLERGPGERRRRRPARVHDVEQQRRAPARVLVGHERARRRTARVPEAVGVAAPAAFSGDRLVGRSGRVRGLAEHARASARPRAA